MNHENWQNKLARNRRAKELKAEGYTVKMSSFGPAEMHPMYIEDLKNTSDGQDTGFGNVVYKTLFARLYRIEFSRVGA